MCRRLGQLLTILVVAVLTAVVGAASASADSDLSIITSTGVTNPAYASDDNLSTLAQFGNSGSNIWYQYRDGTGQQVNSVTVTVDSWTNTGNSVRIRLKDTSGNSTYVPPTGSAPLGTTTYTGPWANITQIYLYGAYAKVAEFSVAGPPASPTNVQSHPGLSQVTVDWTASVSSGISEYRIYRDGVRVGTVSGTTLSYTDSAVVNGTSYQYSVSAVNADGESKLAANAYDATPVDQDYDAGVLSLHSSSYVSGAAYVYDNNLSTSGKGTSTSSHLRFLATSADNQLKVVYLHAKGPTTLHVKNGALTTLKTFSVSTWGVYKFVGPWDGAIVELAGTFDAYEVRVQVAVDAPNALNATVDSNGQVSLSWDASTTSGLDGYNVYRDGVVLGTTSASTRSYLDSTAVGGQTYTYGVAAVKNVVVSNQTTATVTVEQPIPPTPTGLAGTAGDTTASLTWNPSSGATGYRVYRDGGATPIADVTTTSFTDTGLTNGVWYSYKVSAYNDTGESAQSTSVTVRPMPPLPGTPGSFTGSPDDRSAHLSWSAASGTVDGYRIYQDGVVIGTTTALMYTATNLVNGTSYAFAVAAYNISGEGVKTGSVLITPRDSVPPAAPVVTADPLDAKAILTWPAVADYDLKHYLVTYSQDGGVTWRTPVNVGTVLTYTVSGLTNGIEYLFAVQAVDTSDNGSDYGYATATPIPPPEAPPNFTATGGEGLIDLRWDAPAGTVEGYRLYRDGVFLIDLTTTTYRDSPLTNGVTYTYSLYAYNPSGMSPAAGPASAVPTDTSPPAAPASATAYVRGAYAGWIVWEPVLAQDLKQYRLYRNGVQVGTQSKTRRVFLFEGLTSATSYTFSVAAEDTAGNLSPQTAITAETLPNATSATINRQEVSTTSVPYVSPTLTREASGSYRMVKLRAGRTGFPAVTSGTTGVSGQAGSVPGYYTVEVLNAAGTVLGTTQALADGSWSVTTSEPFAADDVLTIRWRL